jgi:hypothetical protein
VFSSLSHPRLRSIPEHKGQRKRRAMDWPRIIEKGLVISINTLFFHLFHIFHLPSGLLHFFVPQRPNDLYAVDFAYKGLPSQFGVLKNTILHTKTLLPRFGMEFTIARVRILSPEQGKLFLLPVEHRVTSLSRVSSPYCVLSKEPSSYCLRSAE